MDKVISYTWEEWKAGREAKRATLRKLGLDGPSLRSVSSSDKHLRKAFGGKRVPNFSSPPCPPPARSLSGDSTEASV